MYLLKNLLFVALVLVSVIEISAQSNNKANSSEKWLFATQDLSIDDPENFFVQNANHFGLSSADEMKFVSSIRGKSGMKHLRYHQMHQGLPVFGGTYTLHVKGAKVVSSSGLLSYHQGGLQTASLSAKEAFIALKTTGDQYADEINATHVEASEMVFIDPSYPSSSGLLALAYKLTINNQENQIHSDFIVDAHTGRLIFESPISVQHNIPASGLTKYVGERDFRCDSLGPQEFYLVDSSRSDGIFTLDGSFNPWTNTSSYWDYGSIGSAAAIDLHFGLTEFYDMMLEKFDWDGIDNDGGALIAMLEDQEYINASWNGQFARFGRGDCNHGPLTTLEVTAHEMTHGVTDYTSNLIYAGESGAINESMSDIFGKALEYYIDRANFTWYIGKSFLLNAYGSYFRSMIDPHERNHPKYYGGVNWVDGAGVHTNSSIGNHWFYNLVEGGSGTNQGGYTYDFDGIGMDKALQIVFLTQKAYLFESSDYNHYYESSVAAAEEIYGAGAAEIDAVIEAWKVVGLPAQRSLPPFDLTLQASLDNTVNCLEDEFLGINFTISNAGSEPYVAATTPARLMFDGEEVAIVDQDLEPGESILIEVDDHLFVDFFDFMFYRCVLEYDQDVNRGNNRGFVFMWNNNPNGLDIEVQAQVQDGGLCSTNKEIDVFIGNNSCESTTGSEEVEIQFINPNTNQVLASFQETLPVIEPGDNGIISLTFDNVDKLQSVVIEATVDNDPVEANNSTRPFFSFVNTIDGDYLMDFEVNYRNEWAVDELQSFNQVNYNNNTAFAVWGDGPNSFFNMCATPEDNVNRNSKGSLSGCLDLTSMDNPIVTFDVAQFRNPDASTFPELLPGSAVLRVLWDDGVQSGREYYYDLEEGTILGQTIPLPSNFQGELRFDFYCHTGGVFGSQDFYDYDVILLDNIQIQNFSSTKDLKAEILNVSPNPSNGIYTLDVDERKVVSSKIYDVSGRLAKNFSNIQSTYNLSELRDGVYFLEVTFEDGQKGRATLVKN